MEYGILHGDSYEIKFKEKLKQLKVVLKGWNKAMKENDNNSKQVLVKAIDDIDEKIDGGVASSDYLHERPQLLKNLDEIEHRQALDIAQKNKIKEWYGLGWNSKFFNGILKQTRKKQNIQGVMVYDVWLTDPIEVKEAFFNYYKEMFGPISVSLPTKTNSRFATLSQEDQEMLQSMVSHEEIKM